MICPNCKKKFSTKISTKKTTEIIDLYEKGLSYRKISETIGGVSYTTCARVAKKYQELVSAGLIKKEIRGENE